MFVIKETSIKNCVDGIHWCLLVSNAPSMIYKSYGFLALSQHHDIDTILLWIIFHYYVLKE